MSTVEVLHSDALRSTSIAASKTPEERKTLLPIPLATVVSLGTAVSSLSIQIGGALGNAALVTARAGTLAGFELGRRVLERTLARAGQDLLQSSTENLGRAHATLVLNQVLETVHLSVTHTTFFVALGFQIGSTSLSASLNTARSCLSAMNAVFGDTETSRSVATIASMIQRECNSEGTGSKDARVTLKDVVMGHVAFALLQQWCRHKTENETREIGSEEIVWDLVLLEDNQPEELPHGSDNLDATQCTGGLISSPTTASSLEPLSLIRTTSRHDQFEEMSIGDGDSLISTASTNSLTRSEEAFRQQVTHQLKPGTSVTIGADQMTTDLITIDIEGEVPENLEPPPGYKVVSFGETNSQDKHTRKIIFQSRKRRRRRGSFEVPNHAEELDPQDLVPESFARSDAYMQQDNTNTDEPSARSQNFERERVYANQAKQRRHNQVPAKGANQTTARSGFISSKLGDGTLNKMKPSSTKNGLKQGRSMKGLVDFWNKDKFSMAQKRKAAMPSQNFTGQGIHDQGLESTTTGLSVSTHDTDLPEGADRKSSGALSVDDGLKLSPSHYRQNTTQIQEGRSDDDTGSVCTKASEWSLLVHPSIRQKSIAVSLQREGTFPGVFPPDFLVRNLARYMRYSVASYGPNLLSLTGNSQSTNSSKLDTSSHHPPEHSSFSFYNNLPPSTVLLSSFACSPQLKKASTTVAENGLPIACFVSLDHDSKCVVLTCRGTFGFEDILTDMTCDYDEFVWQERSYSVHKGILASARWLQNGSSGNQVMVTVKAALEEFRDYGLVLCGHSLGGGVAAILAMLLAERDSGKSANTCKYVTTSSASPQQLVDDNVSALPKGRSIHAYAFGPAATVSPSLQRASRGLITTVLNGRDVVPVLSLGTLRDAQAVASAFKSDEGHSRAEIQKRALGKFGEAIRQGLGLPLAAGSGLSDWFKPDEEDHWPWEALRSLRAKMSSPKLIVPGEVFLIESEAVLRRYAFVDTSPSKGDKSKASVDGSYRPANRVKMIHIKDVERHLSEIQLSSTMFTDHLPHRYEKALDILEKAIYGYTEQPL